MTGAGIRGTKQEERRGEQGEGRGTTIGWRQGFRGAPSASWTRKVLGREGGIDCFTLVSWEGVSGPRRVSPALSSGETCKMACLSLLQQPNCLALFCTTHPLMECQLLVWHFFSLCSLRASLGPPLHPAIALARSANSVPEHQYP